MTMTNTHLPQHLICFDCFPIWTDAARPGWVLLPLENCNQRRSDEEDDAPEEEELGEGDVASALQSGEEYVAKAPATSLSHAVAGWSVANIFRFQNCKGPTVHSNILDDRDDQIMLFKISTEEKPLINLSNMVIM